MRLIKKMPFKRSSYVRSSSKSMAKGKRYKVKRGSYKKYKKSGKKYTKRRRLRKAKSRGNSKLSLALQMAKLLPDQVYINNYPDIASVTGLTNGAVGARQFMWAQNITTATVSSTQLAPINMMTHDLGMVQQILFQQLQNTTTQISAAGATSQVLIKSWKVEGRFTNLETGPIEMIHYRCQARRDFSQSGSASIPTVLTNGFADTIAISPPVGVTNQTLSTTYGATPFMNPRFVATVKVLKSKQYLLKPGATIKLSYNNSRPRLWKNEDFNYGAAPVGDGSTGPTRAILKGQQFSVFLIRGTFATDSGANGGYTVGVGNAALGIIYSHTIHYTTISPQVMQSTAMNAVPGFSSNGCGYPLPIMATWPYSTINETTGARQVGTTFGSTIEDEQQVD